MLTGFDASDNPIYAPAATLASTVATGTDPAWWGNAYTIRPGVQTTGDIVISFDQQLPNAPPFTEKNKSRSAGYHLGGVRVGGTGWLWRTSMATHRNYAGDWPDDGAFDVGNRPQYAGSVPMTVDHHVFYGYYGEFYRGGQVNKYRHYYDNGLYLGDFGRVGNPYGQPKDGSNDPSLNPAEMAGNAHNPWVVKIPDGRVYLYHDDESWHCGVHRWRINGLDTIAEQSIPIVWNAPTFAGLRGEYFDTADLDSAALKTVRPDGTVNFNWGTTIPADTAITAATTWSARWSGFVTPLYSQTYTFYTGTDDGARLWVNDKLIIDQWTKTGSEQSGTIDLTAGQRTAIKLEYFQGTGAAAAKLSWSSASQKKQIVPPSQLCWGDWLYPTPVPGSIDLLAGQPMDIWVLNNLYGWTRDTPTDTGEYTNRWLAHTGRYTYRSARNAPNDLAVKFSNTAKAARFLTRDLGEVSDATTQWTFHTNLNYDGNYHNHGTHGGQYLEVLDDAGVIIARFYPRQVAFPSDSRITANTLDIFQTDYHNLTAEMLQWQPLSISAVDGKIAFAYAAHPPVVTSVFDPAANWRRAKTLRLYYWSAGPHMQYPRTIALRNASFTRTPASIAPNFVLGARTLPGGNRGNTTGTTSTTPGKAIPNETEIAAELIKVREIMGELPKNATAAQKTEAATRLHQRAATTEQNGLRYALLNEALTLAAAADDLRLVTSLVKDLSLSFDMDAASTLTSTLNKIANRARPANERRELVLQLLETADEQIKDEHYDTAELLVKTASTSAGKTSDAGLKKEASQRKLEVEHWWKLHAAAESALQALNKNPNDADAHLARGQYLAIARHDWDNALTHLLKGSDSGLLAAAQLELQAAKDPDRATEIGTAWLDLAEKTSVPAKVVLLERARTWLARGDVSSKGPALTKLNARYKKVDADVRRLAGTAFVKRHPLRALSFEGHWYQYFPDALTWHQARDRCEKLGGTLVCLETAAEAKWVYQFAATQFGKPGDFLFWIGATDEGHDYVYTWVNGSPWQFTDWQGRDPRPGGKAGLAVAVHRTGSAQFRWDGLSPASRRDVVTFICEWER